MNRKKQFCIFGGLNDYGKNLQRKYASDKRIRFVGANYNQDELNNLRYFSRYYFHGHSVGGTNPSLLEAMSSSALIIANDNIFNESILGNEAMYFDNSLGVENILNEDAFFESKNLFSKLNIQKIEEMYNWDLINSTYENFLINCKENS